MKPIEEKLEHMSKSTPDLPLHRAHLRRTLLASKQFDGSTFSFMSKLLPVGLVLAIGLSVMWARPGEAPTPLYVAQSDQETFTTVDSSVIGGGIPVYSQLANAIVIGTVQEVSGGTAILIPDQVLKGDKGADSFEIQVPDLDSNIWIEDFASLEVGEKVLLFLGTDVNNNFVIFAGDYGKYTIDASNNVTCPDETVISLEEAIAQIEIAM